jgi:hypothetical protein
MHPGTAKRPSTATWKTGCQVILLPGVKVLAEYSHNVRKLPGIAGHTLTSSSVQER